MSTEIINMPSQLHREDSKVQRDNALGSQSTALSSASEAAELFFPRHQNSLEVAPRALTVRSRGAGISANRELHRTRTGHGAPLSHGPWAGLRALRTGALPVS